MERSLVSSAGNYFGHEQIPSLSLGAWAEGEYL